MAELLVSSAERPWRPARRVWYHYPPIDQLLHSKYEMPFRVRSRQARMDAVAPVAFRFTDGTARADEQKLCSLALVRFPQFVQDQERIRLRHQDRHSYYVWTKTNTGINQVLTIRWSDDSVAGPPQVFRC